MDLGVDIGVPLFKFHCLTTIRHLWALYYLGTMDFADDISRLKVREADPERQ
jgi:hypothetical protein